MGSHREGPLEKQAPRPTRSMDFFATAHNAHPSDANAGGLSNGGREERDGRDRLPLHPCVGWRSGVLVRGRYTIEDEIGRGGKGVVYRASDLLRHREVAIKAFSSSGDSEDREIVEEVALQDSLLYEGIVRTYDLDRDPESQQLFLTMEYIHGGSMEAILQRAEDMGLVPLIPLPTLAVWLSELGRTLDFIHRKGLVHQDLKPSNLLLPLSGGLKLTDFGLASKAYSRTLRGRGSAIYMAPEQVQGGTISPQTDLYALAILVYRCLTGRLFYGRMPGPYAWLQEQGVLPLFSSSLDPLLLQALDARPSSRPSDALSFVQTLLQALEPSASLQAFSLRSESSLDPERQGTPMNPTSSQKADAPAPPPSTPIPLQSPPRGPLRRDPALADLSGKGLSYPFLQEFENKALIKEMKLCRLSLQEADLILLQLFPALERLDFWETPLGNLDLSALFGIPHLSDLALGLTGFHDKQAKATLRNLPSLRHLQLWGTALTDASTPTLAAMPALERLHLGRTAITDKGLKSLASSPSLRSLDLQETLITDKGLRWLGKIQTLRTCSLRQTPVTAAGIEILQRELPRCTILWGV